MNDHAIILTGFMGTGKSTVGPLVAAKLGRTFLDLDDLVEGLAGRSVAALFAEGEEVFRWWEQRALGQLDLTQPLVLATGGGTLVGAWNQARVSEALVVVLDAPLDVIRERVGTGEGRPLANELAMRYGRRFAAFGRLPHHVSTRGRSPEQVANEVIHFTIQAKPRSEGGDAGEGLVVRTPHGGSYPIHVQRGIAAGVGGFVSALQPGAVAIVTDSVVAPFWGEALRHDLMAARLPTTLIEIPHGERHKTLQSMELIYDGLLDAGIDRSGAIVALGGGVVGDVAGFAAATWMRGTRGFVQVPTTLLSMVDASVGGKTGVDHARGKNLIGAFRHPDAVLVDPTFLSTLPPRELRNGLAETIKHGIIGDPALFHEMASWGEQGDNPSFTPLSSPKGAPPHPLTPSPPHPLTPSLLARAIRVKAEVVERDPYERGERATLNLGHTFGHAYEWLSGYQLGHGEAVSIGIVTAARLSERLGLAQAGLADQIEQVLAGVGLPTRWSGEGAEAVWEAMQSDKKRAARGLRFVLPRAIGDVIVTAPGEVPQALVLEVIEGQRVEADSQNKEKP